MQRLLDTQLALFLVKDAGSQSGLLEMAYQATAFGQEPVQVPLVTL